jgi:hypothetical protein
MIEELTELQYSEDRQGPWKLYVYDHNSQFHRGGIWFREKPKYPDEEITTAEAKERVDKAIRTRREVRICDGGDMLVFHAKNGAVVYGEKFFSEIGDKK